MREIDNLNGDNLPIAACIFIVALWISRKSCHLIPGDKRIRKALIYSLVIIFINVLRPAISVSFQIIPHRQDGSIYIS